MDRNNFANLIYLSAEEHKHKIHVLLDFVPSSDKDIPDPYMHNNGFNLIYVLIYEAVARFLKQLVP